MPRRHREFLSYMSEKSRVRQYAESQGVTSRVSIAYNEAVEALVAFRNIHIQIVARYIINPSRSPVSDRVVQRKGLNLATASSRAADSDDLEKKQQLAGTGGTMLIPFLKKTRDETSEATISS